jgi:GcrA cell cycle regulator
MNDWTEERVATIKTQWADGWSASVIARHLGDGFTRNAVLGKLLQLGMLGNGTGVSRAPVREKILASAPRQRPKDKPGARAEAPIDEPEAIGPLNDLPTGGCKFIHGDVGAGDWRACGHKTAHPLEPWCPHHRARCWIKTQKRGGGKDAALELSKLAAVQSGIARAFG